MLPGLPFTVDTLNLILTDVMAWNLIILEVFLFCNIIAFYPANLVISLSFSKAADIN